MTDEFVNPDRVVTAARRWIGTPYRHQASLIDGGADCLGVVRGVWRELYGDEPETPPPYSRSWGEVAGDERLWRAASRWLAPATGLRRGNVLLFRMIGAASAKHLAIIGSDEPGAPTVIHAYSGRAVLESPLVESWRRRVVSVFQFPGKA